MKLVEDNIIITCNEREIYNSRLQLDNCDILELGCGKAELTRDIASNGQCRRLVALEVDARQHQQNLLINDLPNVSFQSGAAEAIPLADNSQDVVFMFKSLHHVPADKLEQALLEIQRVLKAGGQAYISEPVFMGDFNDILRLFHDEEQVRLAAFQALQHAVAEGIFTLREEIFFNTRIRFKGFADFENNVLQVSHSSFSLSDAVYREVRQKFAAKTRNNSASFDVPMRVDILQKPG